MVFVVKSHAGRHQSSKLVVRFSPCVQPMIEHVIFHGVRPTMHSGLLLVLVADF